jgi:site-specific DNA-methyltransferase (adenine-specific)
MARLQARGGTVTPYYSDKWVTIYHGDCREILPSIDVKVDLVLTDPPYGISGGKGNNRTRAKGIYEADFEDTEEYVKTVCVPAFESALSTASRGVLTPGNKNIHLYPQPNDIGAFIIPYSIGLAQWGVQSLQLICYYGKDPYPQKMKSSSYTTGEHPPQIVHPCPKPIGAWIWLLARSSIESETVLDPFLGSGTTCYCAKKLNRYSIGIEIEEKYCEIAAKRCSQEVMELKI